MLSLIEINVICCADVRLFCYKMSTRPVVVAAAAAVSESFLQQLRFIQCNHCRNVREMCVFLVLLLLLAKSAGICPLFLKNLKLQFWVTLRFFTIVPKESIKKF